MDELLQHATHLANQTSHALSMPIKGRVAYVVSHGQSYASNGYAIRTQGVAKALNQHGFETLCFVRPGRPWELKQNIQPTPPEVTIQGVRYIHSRWPNDVVPSNEREHLEASVQQFMTLFSVYRPEVVLAASNWIVGLPAWVAAKRLGLPFYNEVRGFWELSRAAQDPAFESSKTCQIEAERDTFVAKQGITTFTLNAPMQEELVKRGVKRESIQLVPNGVSELPKIAPADPALKKRLGIQEGDKVVGYIGSHSVYEGLDTLIAACEALVQQGQKIKLLLVGDHQPITQAHKADKANVKQSWLIQTGRVPHEEVAKFYSIIDVVVIPRKPFSVSELVPPMKAFEAISYGKPLIASNVLAMKDFSKIYPVKLFDNNKGAVELSNLILMVLSGQESPNKKKLEDLLFSKSIKTTIFNASADSIKNNATVPLQSNKTKGRYKFCFTELSDLLSFGFSIKSDKSYDKTGAILALTFRNFEGEALEPATLDTQGYSWSAAYGRYKYLPVCDSYINYCVKLDVPPEASSCEVVISSRKYVKLNMRGDLISSSDEFDYTSLNQVIAWADKKESYKLEDAINVVKQPGCSLDSIINYIKTLPGHELLVADIYWAVWVVTKDPIMFGAANRALVYQGRMYDTKKLLDSWENIYTPNNTGVLSRRVSDEIAYLEQGFEVLDKGACEYQPDKSVLYLLHNRLPYNSGGYATRTHGLLTGVEKISDFKMSGVSRPGYPTDHAQHISFKLPSPIPKKDVIDKIEYFSLDQRVRRSSLTISEYIEGYAREVEAVARDQKACVIHAAANFPNGLAASLAASRLGIKSVYEVRGLWEITRLSRQEGWDKTDQFNYMAKMEAEACKAADEVLTITQALKDLMVERGVEENKITVVPNCVHTDLFKPLEKNNELASSLNINCDDVVIGYIGSIVNYEGLDDLLQALALLVKEGIVNFKFLLVGDGAVLDELKDLVVQLGLTSHVVITGRVPHDKVQEYYSLVDITPFPRKPYLVCEAVSPLKPFEAMASEKAVVVSSCAALTEIIEHNKTGLVFVKGDIESLKEKLKELIVDKELRLKLAKSGRDWVIKERDWSNSAAKLVYVYNSLITGVRFD